METNSGRHRHRHRHGFGRKNDFENKFSDRSEEDFPKASVAQDDRLETKKYKSKNKWDPYGSLKKNKSPHVHDR